MSIIVHHERPLSVTTTSGGWSGNTCALRGLLQQIVIRPNTETTQYDLSLTDDMNTLVYERTDAQGDIIEEVEIPINGVYTMAISNATRDESFEVVLIVRER